MQALIRLSLAVATLIGLANSVAVEIEKRASSLEVLLSAGANAQVKATIKNVGATDLTLLTYGTLFDTAAVEKVDVYSAGMSVYFILKLSSSTPNHLFLRIQDLGCLR